MAYFFQAAVDKAAAAAVRLSEALPTLGREARKVYVEEQKLLHAELRAAEAAQRGISPDLVVRGEKILLRMEEVEIPLAPKEGGYSTLYGIFAVGGDEVEAARRAAPRPASP